MKDEEKNAKKISKRLIIVIAVIIVIAAIAFGFYSGIFSLPTGLVAAQTTGNQVTPQTGTLSSNQVTRDLPYYESMNLPTGKHSLEFSSDTLVWVYIMDENNFDSWKSTGTINFVDMGTGHTDADKVKSYTGTFVVPEGEGGTHYILVEGAEKASISYKIA